MTAREQIILQLQEALGLRESIPAEHFSEWADQYVKKHPPHRDLVQQALLKYDQSSVQSQAERTGKGLGSKSNGPHGFIRRLLFVEHRHGERRFNRGLVMLVLFASLIGAFVVLQRVGTPTSSKRAGTQGSAATVNNPHTLTPMNAPASATVSPVNTPATASATTPQVFIAEAGAAPAASDTSKGSQPATSTPRVKQDHIDLTTAPELPASNDSPAARGQGASASPNHLVLYSAPPTSSSRTPLQPVASAPQVSSILYTDEPSGPAASQVGPTAPGSNFTPLAAPARTGGFQALPVFDTKIDSSSSQLYLSGAGTGPAVISSSPQEASAESATVYSAEPATPGTPNSIFTYTAAHPTASPVVGPSPTGPTTSSDGNGPTAADSPPALVATPKSAVVAPPPGSTVSATLVVGLEVATGSSVPAVATADGRQYLGRAALDQQTSRVQITFTRMVAGGQVVPVTALAYSLKGYLGIPAGVRVTTPQLAANLVQSAAAGVSNYVNSLTNQQTTYQTGAALATSTTAPTLGESLAQAVANMLKPPTTTQAVVRIATLSPHTKVMLLFQ